MKNKNTVKKLHWLALAATLSLAGAGAPSFARHGCGLRAGRGRILADQVAGPLRRRKRALCGALLRPVRA